MNEKQQEIFNMPVGELQISDDLKSLLREKGYNRLKDVMAKKIGLLRKDEGLSFEHEMELYKVVEANDLVDYWKE